MTAQSVTCTGTASNPGWIVGGSGINISGLLEISGSYCIIDGIKVTGGRDAGVGISGHHIALRNSEVSGPYSGRGASAGVFTGEGASDVVIYRNKVHDRGDLSATFDQDAHGIAVGQGSTRIWVLENELYRNSGDGVQLNPYPYSTGRGTIRFVYVGKNKAWGNKQTGIWAKMSADVIVSENEIHDHRPSDSSAGQCSGYQQGTERAWFVYNNIYNCASGIYIAGDYGDEPSTMQTYIVGNQIHDLFPASQSQGVWSDAAIRLTGGREHRVVANQLTRVPSGIHATRIAGLFVGENTIMGLGPGGSQVRSDAPVSNITAESVYATFQTLYGLSIRPAGSAQESF